jgi:hypothetical protein
MFLCGCFHLYAILAFASLLLVIDVSFSATLPLEQVAVVILVCCVVSGRCLVGISGYLLFVCFMVFLNLSR